MTRPSMRTRPALARVPRRRHAAWLEIVLFMIGAGVFAVLLSRIGVAPIVEALTGLGPALVLIVAVEFLAVLANTLSWRCTIVPARREDVPFSRLIAARIVGDALNYVIPAGVGEISKVRLLSRYIGVESAIASVAMAKLTEGIALGLFGFLGLIVVWPILATNPARTVPIAVALAGAGLAVSCLIVARLG